MTTKAEHAHLSRVASLPCALCGAMPVHVHHLKEECGAGQRQSHYLTIPLCESHHTGGIGIHGLGRKAFERTYKLTELDLLAKTIGELWK